MRTTIWMAGLTLALALAPRGAAQEQTLPMFIDVTTSAGITHKHSYGDSRLSNIVEGTGSGVTCFDYDGDGFIDLYFPNGAWVNEVSDNRGRALRGQLRNALYRNRGDGTFEDVTEKAGVGDLGFGFSASAVDFDGDGHMDLYVLNYGPNVLYRNNGDGTFTDVTEGSGLECPLWSVSAVWFDYNGNGRLDVYVANYLEYDSGQFRTFYPAQGYPGPLSYNGRPDALYRNNGDGTFTNVTEEAGILRPDGRAMSATAVDLDGDGLLDIYVANDAMENYYFRNNGDGTFEDLGLITGLAFGEGGQGVSSMGPTSGDVNRDGRMDLYIPDMNYGCLFINEGDMFVDRTTASNLAVVSGQYTGWGGLLFDYDNDGHLDVFVSNGHAHFEFPEEDLLMRNTGGGVFEDVARRSGAYFDAKYVGRGSAYVDLDNNGTLDLVVAMLNDLPRVLRNGGGSGAHWFKVDPRLANGKSPAIGARVTVRVGERTMVHDVMPYTGYLSQSDWRAHFGLGRAQKVDTLEIRWPDGRTLRLEDIEANQILKITQDADQ